MKVAESIYITRVAGGAIGGRGLNDKDLRIATPFLFPAASN